MVTYNEDGTVDYSRMIQVSCNKTGFYVNSVYPNPTKDKVWLNFQVMEEKRLILEVVDVLGRVLIKEAFIPDNIHNSRLIDLSTLDNGYYFIFLNNGTEQLVTKVAKRQF